MSRLKTAMLEAMMDRQMALFENQMALLDRLIDGKKEEEDDDEKKILSRIENRLNKSADEQVQIYPA